MNLYAVVVIYNKNCQESITYKYLNDIKNIKTIVCDNSTKNFLNKEKVEDDGNIYIDMKGNKGLSKAYNAAIDFIKDTKGVLCLFDDDTKIPEEYFEILQKTVQESMADIYLPLVYDEIGVLSPCRIDGAYVTRVKNIENISIKNITGINSGMAVDLSVFKDYRYDERYFLDYIDHAFIRDMKGKNKKIVIISGMKINQRFAANDVTNFESSLNRFRIFKKDFRLFCSNTIKNKLIGEMLLFKRRVYLIYKFRSFDFFM